MRITNYDLFFEDATLLAKVLKSNPQTVNCVYCVGYPEICDGIIPNCLEGIILNIRTNKELFNKNHLTKEILAELIFNSSYRCFLCKNKCRSNNEGGCLEGILAKLNSPAIEVE